MDVYVYIYIAQITKCFDLQMMCMCIFIIVPSMDIHIVTNYCVYPGLKSSGWNQGGSSRDQRSQPRVNVWDRRPPTRTPYDIGRLVLGGKK